MQVRHPPGGGRGRDELRRAAQVPLGPARQRGQAVVRDRPLARNASTICCTERSPSRPPWKASMKITFGGQEQAGSVTASASGTTASQGRPVSRLTVAK